MKSVFKAIQQTCARDYKNPNMEKKYLVTQYTQNSEKTDETPATVVHVLNPSPSTHLY